MNKPIDLVIKCKSTNKGFSATCDLIPGWVVAVDGDFKRFENEVRDCIKFYVECAIRDNEPINPIFNNYRRLVFNFS